MLSGGLSQLSELQKDQANSRSNSLCWSSSLPGSSRFLIGLVKTANQARGCSNPRIHECSQNGAVNNAETANMFTTSHHARSKGTQKPKRSNKL